MMMCLPTATAGPWFDRGEEGGRREVGRRLATASSSRGLLAPDRSGLSEDSGVGNQRFSHSIQCDSTGSRQHSSRLCSQPKTPARGKKNSARGGVGHASAPQPSRGPPRVRRRAWTGSFPSEPVCLAWLLGHARPAHSIDRGPFSIDRSIDELIDAMHSARACCGFLRMTCVVVNVKGATARPHLG